MESYWHWALIRGLNLKNVSTYVSLGHLKFKRQEKM